MGAYDPLCRAGTNQKIRVPLAFAPVEHIAGDGRFSMNGGTYYRSTPQAQRCPRCKALLAIGDSYNHHIFWCDRAVNG